MRQGWRVARAPRPVIARRILTTRPIKIGPPITVSAKKARVLAQDPRFFFFFFSNSLVRAEDSREAPPAIDWSSVPSNQKKSLLKACEESEL